MVDSFKHKGLRNKLVEELSNKGIKDVKVLDAVSKVPRHLFMDCLLYTSDAADED